MQTTNNTILITGGSSGIGRALAEALHAQGNHVIVTGRRQPLLDELTRANPGMAAYAFDATDPRQIRELAGRVVELHPSLNVLVNNAGIMRVEDLQRHELADAEETIATNLLAPIRLTAALLPHLQKQVRSAILNVTSGLAFVPLTTTPTYNATKAALHSYSQSLRHQLRGTSVEVIEVIPPAVQTDLVPGHAENPHAMPLADYVSEVMQLLATDATEVCVERVKALRFAEAEHRFDAMFAALNPAST